MGSHPQPVLVRTFKDAVNQPGPALGPSPGPPSQPQGPQGHPWICSSSTSISPGAQLWSPQGSSRSRLHVCQNRSQGKLQVGCSSPCRSSIWSPIVNFLLPNI